MEWAEFWRNYSQGAIVVVSILLLLAAVVLFIGWLASRTP